MHKRTAFALLFFVVGSLALPHLAHAAAAIPFFGPIIDKSWTVSSTGIQCALGWGAVLTVVNNIIKLLITLAVIFVAPIMIAYSGFLLVINPMNPGGKARAKTILTNTIVGLVIALSGWLIVDALMAVLYHPNDSSWGTWSSLVTSGGALTCLPQEGVGTGLNQSTNGAAVTVTPTTVPPTTNCTTSYSTNLPGIKVTSTDNCCDKTKPKCTSLDGMQQSTIDQVINIKSACGNGCTVTVTGGTETGHSSGTYSHTNGYKVDLSQNNSALNSLIQSLPLTGQRGGDSGGPVHSDACGNQYVQESDHWDITVFKVCSL